MSFCGLKKGISLKICIVLSVIINKRSFESERGRKKSFEINIIIDVSQFSISSSFSIRRRGSFLVCVRGQCQKYTSASYGYKLFLPPRFLWFCFSFEFRSAEERLCTRTRNYLLISTHL